MLDRSLVFLDLETTGATASFDRITEIGLIERHGVACGARHRALGDARVLSHFSGDRRLAKDMRIVQQVKRIDWKETAGELGALLEEARLVKEQLPILNRQLRRNNDWYAFARDPAQRQALRLISGANVDFSDTAHVYGLFRTKRTALDTLRKPAQAFELCLIVTGLEKGQGPCFAHQIKRCRGACAGKESRAQHDLRLMQALSGLKQQAWPFKGRIGVREASGGRTDLHVLDHWCYLGTVRAEHELHALDAKPVFDLDTYKILKRFLAGAGNALEIVPLAGFR